MKTFVLLLPALQVLLSSLPKPIKALLFGTTLLPPKPCPAAVFISGNDDLLTLILLRLPFKSVAKFKSVSRHWLYLITTTPQFSLPKPLKALFSDDSLGTLIPLDGTSPPLKTILYPSKNSRYQHSCNGLYLFYEKICTFALNNINEVDEFYVSNPTTKLYATLPQQDRRRLSVKAAYLAFNPHVSPHYKVVGFFSHDTMIYSSETRQWTSSATPARAFHAIHRFKHGVFWNDAIYWTSLDWKDPFTVEEHSLKDKPQVYRFNAFGDEKMERVALPSSDHVLYLGLSGGEHLHLIMGVYDDHFDSDVAGLNMYEMDKGSHRWRHVYCLRDLAGDVRARFDFVKVVPTLWTLPWLRSFGRVPCCSVVFFDAEETCLYLAVGKILVRYDLKARTVFEVYRGKYCIGRSHFTQHMEIVHTAGLTPMDEASLLVIDK